MLSEKKKKKKNIVIKIEKILYLYKKKLKQEINLKKEENHKRLSILFKSTKRNSEFLRNLRNQIKNIFHKNNKNLNKKTRNQATV